MRTISKPSEGLFKDRGSKFIGYAFSVSTRAPKPARQGPQRLAAGLRGAAAFGC